MENRPDTDGLMQMLHELGEACAAGLSASLSTHLGTTVRVVALDVERLPYRHFLLALDDVTCLGLLRVDPPGAQACVDIPLHLMRAMVKRLLGGGSRAPGAITEIERGMALQIIERVAAEFSRSASRVNGAALSIREESLEFNPRSLRMMPENEPVTIALFDLSIGHDDHTEITGTMRLCLPDPVIEQLLDGGADRAHGLSATRSSHPHRAARDMLSAAAELRAMLAETKLRLSDVLAMQVGDVITTERPVENAVTVEIDAGQSVTGQLGQFQGMRAVQTTHDASLPRSVAPFPAGGDLA